MNVQRMQTAVCASGAIHLAPHARGVLSKGRTVLHTVACLAVLLMQTEPGLTEPLELKAAILDYGRSSPELMRFMDERIMLKIGGDRPARAGMHWMAYFNVQGIGTPQDMLKLKDFALAKGIAVDDMLLHATRNFSSKLNPAYRGMDRFDAFEGKNGVLIGEGANLKDMTSQAYDAPTPLGPEVYLGYEEPFAEVNWQFIKASQDQSARFEYFGAQGWRPLAVRDDTGGLARNGRSAFIPPADWTKTSLNGSRVKYFIRLRLENGQDIVTKRIFGDAWTNGAENACRGWDADAPGIVNSGELAFQPRPPSNASARFRYQARITFWRANASVADVRMRQGDDLLWADFAARSILARAQEQKQTGVMCDDAQARPTVPLSMTDFGGSTSEWDTAMRASNQDIIRRIHAARPDFAVGSNIARKDILFDGDWGLMEYHSLVWRTGRPRGIASKDAGTANACYDDFLPANNPKKVFCLMMYADPSDVVPARKIPWDRANRGPMSALSKHYIAMNEHTYFAYHSKGDYFYDERDDVILKNGKTLHLAVDAIPRVEEVRRWGQWFPAMGVPLGGPDPLGHKQGAYDLDWKSAFEMGERSPVWRRDYVSAIVLHRPAFTDTSSDAYERFGPELDLGGAFYPLRADGSTGPALTRIALRPAEGAILMRRPLSLGVRPLGQSESVQ